MSAAASLQRCLTARKGTERIDPRFRGPGFSRCLLGGILIRGVNAQPIFFHLKRFSRGQFPLVYPFSKRNAKKGWVYAKETEGKRKMRPTQDCQISRD